jgi:integrase
MRGIKKLRSGRYQARYFAGYDANGKRLYPSKTFRTQTAALKWRTARLHEKDLGQYVEGSTLTVGAYIDRWLVSMAQRARENTLYNYRQIINLYIKPDLGNIKLANLRPYHIEQWQSRLLARLSVKSVVTARIVLTGALRKAVRLRLIGSSPVADTDPPKLIRKEKRSLSIDEARRFLMGCRDDSFGVYFAMAIYTGLRPEELKAVKWKNLDLEVGPGKRGAVHVREALLWVPGVKKFVSPKTKNGIRSVAFPQELVAMLVEHRKRQLEVRLSVGRHYENLDLVFANPVGTPLVRATLERHLKAILRAANITEHLRQYDLRHSFVTLSLVAGVDIKTVSQEAGHATVAFTLDHYAHVHKTMQESASVKREALLAG